MGIRLRCERKVVSISERVISMDNLYSCEHGYTCVRKRSVDGSTFCHCHSVHSLVCIRKPALAIGSREMKYFSSCLN